MFEGEGLGGGWFGCMIPWVKILLLACIFPRFVSITCVHAVTRG